MEEAGNLMSIFHISHSVPHSRYLGGTGARETAPAALPHVEVHAVWQGELFSYESVLPWSVRERSVSERNHSPRRYNNEARKRLR